MKLTRPLAVASLVAASVLIAVPASAHTGTHPFANCTEAKRHGYSSIPEGDKHYAPNLDADSDGYGCDKHGVLANDGRAGTGYYAESVPGASPSTAAGDLAETGGPASAPYVVGASAIMLAGGGYLALRRRRQV